MVDLKNRINRTGDGSERRVELQVTICRAGDGKERRVELLTRGSGCRIDILDGV